MYGFGTAIGGIPRNRDGLRAAGRVAPGRARLGGGAARSDRADRAPSAWPPSSSSRSSAPAACFPGDGLHRRRSRAVRRHGVLFDRRLVICGFGRLGTWFGIERWDVEPDMIVFAKGVTSGYLPLGGVIVSDTVAEPSGASRRPGVSAGPTYSGPPHLLRGGADEPRPPRAGGACSTAAASSRARCPTCWLRSRR